MREGFFSQEFLTALPPDHLEALVKLATEFARLHSAAQAHRAAAPGSNLKPYDCHDDYVEALAIFRSFCELKDLKFKIPVLGPEKNQNINLITTAISEHAAQWQGELSRRTANSLLADKSQHYAALFTAERRYEFSAADFARGQILSQELRELISASQLIAAPHKRRLLRRLDALAPELAKQTSDIDRFWGFLVEAGIVARKYGADLHPLTERVTELAKIIIATVLPKEGVTALPEIASLFASEQP